MAISVYRSYLPPVNFVLPLVAGRYYDSLLYSTISFNTAAFSPNTSGTLFAIPNSVTVTSIGIEIVTGTSGSARFGVYNIDSNGFPGTLALDTGLGGQTGSIGFLSSSTSLKLKPGWYWIFCSTTATSGGGLRTSNQATIHSSSAANISSPSGAAFIGIVLESGNPGIANNGFPGTFMHHSLFNSTQVRSDVALNTYFRVMIGV